MLLVFVIPPWVGEPLTALAWARCVNKSSLLQVQAELAAAKAAAEEAKKKEEEEAKAAAAAAVKQQSDKSRPVSSNPVAGTPWCVVWTGDHKVTLNIYSNRCGAVTEVVTRDEHSNTAPANFYSRRPTSDGEKVGLCYV